MTVSTQSVPILLSSSTATSRQVVDFDHRQPRSSSDLSEQLPGILTSFEGVHLRHRAGAEVATI
jgi:hypothetical protein